MICARTDVARQPHTDERLQLSQVRVTDREINAEAVPGLAVAVLKVMAEPRRQVRGQAYVVKFAAPVEGVNAGAVADGFPSLPPPRKPSTLNPQPASAKAWRETFSTCRQTSCECRAIRVP